MPTSSRPALYRKLPPGPHAASRQAVASNQRARLYGAMIELVATRGYEACTVAELCALAGVSKRTLYERFPGGKETCFLATYDVIVRRAKLHILAAESSGQSTTDSATPALGLATLADAFGQEVATYPNAARLVLVEAFDAGPAAVARTQRTMRLIQRMIAASIRQSPNGAVASAVVVEAILATGTRVLRARLRDARLTELPRELCDACLAASAAPELRRPLRSVADQASRDRNGPLHSNRRAASVRGDGSAPQRHPFRADEPTRGGNYRPTDPTRSIPAQAVLTMSARRGPRW